MASTSTRMQALKAYRHLLRTENMRFAGDLRTLAAAKAKTRAEFEENRHLTDKTTIDKAILEAVEAEIVLHKLVVQAVVQPDNPGIMKARISDEHERRT